MTTEPTDMKIKLLFISMLLFCSCEKWTAPEPAIVQAKYWEGNDLQVFVHKPNDARLYLTRYKNIAWTSELHVGDTVNIEFGSFSRAYYIIEPPINQGSQ